MYCEVCLSANTVKVVVLTTYVVSVAVPDVASVPA